MRLTFLGTSGGKPTRERNVSALALEFDQDNKWYLFDCGEATQHQLMRTRPSVGKLAAIFISHMHGDHIFGLPGLLASKRLDGALQPLHIYGPNGIEKFLRCFTDLSFDYLGYEMTITEYAAGDAFVFDRFTLTVLPLVHSVESHAFHIKEHDVSNRLDEPKLRAAGLEPSPRYGELKKGRRVEIDGTTYEPRDYMLEPVISRRIIIAGDNAEPAVLGDYLNGLNLLVHESTYTQEVYDGLKEKLLHTTARDLGLAAQAHGVHNVIATHISPRYGGSGKHSVGEIEAEIRARYEGNVFIAEDFAAYALRRDGAVEKM
jgi:ribonuclease Z